MTQILSDKKERDNGLPKNGEPLFLIIGKIRKPHGVAGELLVEVITDFPERIKPGRQVFLGEKKIEKQIETARFIPDGVLLKFQGLNDREEAGTFRNQLVYINSEDLPQLHANEYYFHELIGMEVKSQDGEILGTVKEILETGANKVLVVSHSGKEDLIPFINKVIIEVNKKGKEIIVKKQEWE